MAQTTPPEKCVFEGTARNSVTQLGIPKVTIRLIPNNGSIGYVGSSKPDGTFRFENVVPGDYRVEAQRAGYSAQWVLSDRSGHAIPTLSLTAGQILTGNILGLTPDGAISGKVIAPDGEPLPFAVIHMIERKWRRGKRVYLATNTATTDDAGVFHFGSVAAGHYWIYAARPNSSGLGGLIVDAAGQTEMRIAGRYYPNAAHLDAAAPIEVRAGEEVSGIDFKLPLAPVFHITGAYSNQGEKIGIALTSRYRDQKLDWETEGASLGKDGKFSFDAVPSGSYFLYSRESSSRDLVIGPKLPVTVGAKDVASLIAPPVSRIELKGRIRAEGDSALEKIPVLIFCEGSEADAYTAAQCRTEPQPNGSFTIRNLTADRYLMRIANLETGKDGGYYLKTLTVNGVQITGHEIDLTGGPPESVELVLSATTGGLEGTVVRPEPPEAADLTVVMIPGKLPSGASEPMYAYLDPTSHFQATDLEPGTYRIFAVPAYDWGLWQNAEFLRLIAGRGVSVEVTANARTGVEVHALRASDVRQAEEKVEQ
jgi:hypothetical protein